MNLIPADKQHQSRLKYTSTVFYKIRKTYTELEALLIYLKNNISCGNIIENIHNHTTRVCGGVVFFRPFTLFCRPKNNTKGAHKHVLSKTADL